MNSIFEDFYKYEDNRAVFKLNSEIYDKETILQAAYVLLDDLYILIDKKEGYYYLYVKSKKNDVNFEKMAYNLLNELIEAKAYIEQAKRTKEVRQTLLEKALMSNSIDSDDLINQEDELFGELKEEDFYNEEDLQLNDKENAK